MSGLPSAQPSGKLFAGGRSFASPSGPPRSTHSPSVAFSPAESAGSYANTTHSREAFQGGITPSAVARFNSCFFFETSSKRIRGNGAMPPSWWQDWQRRWRIGATSRLKVGSGLLDTLFSSDVSSRRQPAPSARTPRAAARRIRVFIGRASWHAPSGTVKARRERRGGFRQAAEGARGHEDQNVAGARLPGGGYRGSRRSSRGRRRRLPVAARRRTRASRSRRVSRSGVWRGRPGRGRAASACRERVGVVLFEHLAAGRVRARLEERPEPAARPAARAAGACRATAVGWCAKSSTTRMPFVSPLTSSRRLTPSKRGRARAISPTERPRPRASAIAPRALRTLCVPRAARRAAPPAGPPRPA